MTGQNSLQNGYQIVYFGTRLPTLTETFVSQEFLALHKLGCSVKAVSVYPPNHSELLEDFAQRHARPVVVYTLRNWLAATMEAMMHPRKSWQTLSMCWTDINRPAESLSWNKRLRILFQCFSSLGIARQLRSWNVRHIHAHMANTPTSIAMYAAAQLGISFSFTGHANDLFVHRTLLTEKLKRCAFVACISHWHQEFYRGFCELPVERLPIIRCGVDTNRSERKRLDTPGDQSLPLRVLSVGRLVNKKGMDVLLQALALVGDELPVRCEIVGDGPQKERLLELCSTLKLKERVHFSGALPNTAVLEKLHACDVFVLACRRDPETGDQDGIPVSLMEAMAAGCLVITSDLVPITELVIDGETGYCVPPDDAAELASAIKKSGVDRAARERLVTNAQRHVHDEFDRTQNAERLATLFSKQLARTPK